MHSGNEANSASSLRVYYKRHRLSALKKYTLRSDLIILPLLSARRSLLVCWGWFESNKAWVGPLVESHTVQCTVSENRFRRTASSVGRLVHTWSGLEDNDQRPRHRRCMKGPTSASTRTRKANKLIRKGSLCLVSALVGIEVSPCHCI